MDLDNIQQNMNTRVVFKEPRGMIRWIQLFFAIIAFSTVVDFYTTVGVDITCPTAASSTTTSTTTTSTTTPVPPPAPNSSQAPVPPSPPPPSSSPSPLPPPVAQAALTNTPKLVINYPFNFDQQVVVNTCPGINNTYNHVASLSGSPQFFVMTGVLSLIYASATLTIYLLFSSTYESIPVMPVADLIITGILAFFWFIASASFSSGVSLLKSTATYDSLKQALCPDQFVNLNGAICAPSLIDVPSWKPLNVALVSGYTSFFLWGAGLWFVYKETHFHTPRDQFGTR